MFTVVEAGWHIELDKLVSSSVAQKTKLIPLFRGDKVKMVIELIEHGDWWSSVSQERKKREKMEIKVIMTTWSAKSTTLSRSQFVTDKKHCVAGRLMLFWHLKKVLEKSILFYPFFFYIFDVRLPSVNGAWIERFSFKTQTSRQPCFPCKNRIHLKKWINEWKKSLVFPACIFWLHREAISDSMHQRKYTFFLSPFYL